MDETVKKYSMDERRADIKKLFGLRGKKFAKCFLDLLEKYALFDELIENADSISNGKKVIDALCSVVNVNNQSKGEFFVKVDENHRQTPVKQDHKGNEIKPYFDESFGSYHNGEKYWVRNDLKTRLGDSVGRIPEPARIKFYMTRFLELEDAEVEEIWKMKNNADPKDNREQEQNGSGDTSPRTDKNWSRNRLFFGAPGTGKSHLLNEEAGLGNQKEKTLLENKNKDNHEHYERVTFHPEYSYAHFVGTYKPVPKGNRITYEYVPGPFMRIYAKAKREYIELKEKAKPYLLIIEEINRANVSAVFGEVFQLLDRNKDGESEYSVHASKDISDYLRKEFSKVSCEKKVFERYVAELRIPPNMYIWATMNSADQGVFPMDTAFKRRWDFEYIGIDNGEDEIKDKYVYYGGKSQYRANWNEIRKAINTWMSSAIVNINEDKQLGAFFLSNEIIDSSGNPQEKPTKFHDAFKNKVLMYLFEDAAKQKRRELFGAGRRYSVICKDFDENGFIKDGKPCVFSEESKISVNQTAASSSNENGAFNPSQPNEAKQ